MGKSAPTPPPAPNPSAIAAAQTGSNVNSAIASTMLNQLQYQGPGGSVSYDMLGNRSTPAGDIPVFQQRVNLSPNQQQIFDSTEHLQQRALDTGKYAINNVADSITKPFSLSGLPNAPGSIATPDTQKTFDNPAQKMSLGIDDFSADRARVEEGLMSRFNEDIGKREEDTISRLNAEGIQRGSEGYGDAMLQMDRAKNDAKVQAMLGAGAEQSRLFGMTKDAAQFGNDAAAQQFSQNQAAASFGNAAQNQDFAQDMGAAQYAQGNRQQALSEYALQRSQPINEFATLFGLGGNVQMPQAPQSGGFGVNPADILGANALQYQVLNNNYNTQMQNRNSGMGALGNIAGMLGSAGIMASDRRVKNIHRRIGKTDSGIPLYVFSYKHDPQKVHVGVIAQEAQKIRPDAVLDIGGTLHVDYGRV